MDANGSHGDLELPQFSNTLSMEAAWCEGCGVMWRVAPGVCEASLNRLSYLPDGNDQRKCKIMS